MVFNSNIFLICAPPSASDCSPTVLRTYPSHPTNFSAGASEVFLYFFTHMSHHTRDQSISHPPPTRSCQQETALLSQSEDV